MSRRAAALARAIPFGEVSRYTQLAALSAAMTLGLPVLLHEWGGMAKHKAVAVALVTAFIVNFVIARIYVFKADGAFGVQMLRFAIAAAGFRIAEYLAFLTLHALFGLYYVLALGFVLVASFVAKFVLYRAYVFNAGDDGRVPEAVSRMLELIRDSHRPRPRTSKLFGAWDALALALLFALFLLYPHPGFDGLVPDNIAQTAYWSLLARPELVGSIGSSSPKAGLIVLLGGAHYVSYELLGSPWPFTAMLALLFAATLYLIGRIAADVGGLLAGLLAVLVAAGSTYLPQVFYTGSSNLFFLPPVLCGLVLLSTGRERAAVLALCLAATIRPEALIMIGMIIALRCLRRGDWRRSFEFAAYGTTALAFFVLLAYWTQGSWERIGAGAATGYPAFPSLRTMEHTRSVFGQFFSERFVALLLLPAVYAVIRVERTRVYLYFYSMMLAFAVLVVSGFFGMHFRYIAGGQVIVFALGCGGLVRLYTDLQRSKPVRPGMATIATDAIVVGLVLAVVLWSTRSLATALSTLAIPAVYLLAGAMKHRSGSDALLLGCHALIALFVALAPVTSVVKARQAFSASLDLRQPSVLDALEFLGDGRVPPGSAVIAEDELLNYVLVKRPEHLARARSIQSFNALSDPQRREALSQAEYLYVSKRRNHGWNYLHYFPRATWVTDPFRAVVLDMIRTNRPRSILGSNLEPVYNSGSRFIARIRPGSGGESDTH